MTWKRTRFVLLCAIAGLAVGAMAATDEETWIQTFEGLDYGAFFDVALTADDALIVVGTTYHPLAETTLGDVLIAKIRLDGQTVWEVTYGGEANDQAFGVEPTADGGYLVLAETDSFGAGERDLYVLKLDATGELLWERTYGGPHTEWAKDLVSISSGGFLVVGESDSFGESFDAYVVRIDADGEILWETTLGDASDNETGVAALEAENGELLVLAGVSYPDDGYAGSRRDSRLFRIDENGREMWSMLYRGDVKWWPNDMTFSPDGDLVIVGIAESIGTSQGPLDYWIARADAGTGELIWSRTEGSQYQDDYGVAIVPVVGGGYVVTGFGAGLPMLRFDEDGRLDWLRSGVPSRMFVMFGGFSILALPDGTFVVPGWEYIHRVGDDFDAILLRLNSGGQVDE
jgi:hypothetical protein